MNPSAPKELSSRSLYGVLLLGAILRLAILFKIPQLSRILDHRLECTTPVSSFKRMTEGVFQYLHNYNGSPYDGGIFHQSPLLLALFATITEDWAVNMVFVVSDVLLALGLAKCASGLRARTDFRLYLTERTQVVQKEKDVLKSSAKQSSTIPDESKLIDPSQLAVAPVIAAAFYLFNPFSLLSTLAKSTNALSNMVTVWAIYFAISRSPLKSLTLLALSSVLSVYPAYLAPSLIVLASQREGGAPLDVSLSAAKPYLKQGALFVGLCCTFLGVSYLPTGSWDFLSSTYGTILLFSDLKPNIGLWWYFFTEMFDFFRPFFFAVFQIYMASYSVPMILKFIHQPYFAATTIVGLSAMFKSYPETSDIGLYFSLVILYKPIFSLLRYQIPVVLVTLYCSALAPTFHHLWVYLGSGNSNFFYAINLVQTLAMTLTISDTMWAAVRLDFDGGADSSVLQI